MDLKIKMGTRYRDATRDEVLDAASHYMVSEAIGEKLQSPADTERFLKTMLAGRHEECFVMVCLTNRHAVIDARIIFRGTIDGTSVYPRTVVKAALELNAAAVIVAHNHPSDNAEPSQADERITRRLKAALELIDIRLLDHFIVCKNGITSLANRGMV